MSDQSSFALDQTLARDTVVLGTMPLSLVLLMNESRYPWVILVPRRGGLCELYELPEPDRQQLMRESCEVGKALMDLFRGEKLNVAAIGNVVAQLHLHHVVRFHDDPAWPGPVWGRFTPEPYPDALLQETVTRIAAALSGAAFERAI